MMRSCASFLGLSLLLLICSCSWWAFYEVPRRVIFQQVPEKFADGRSYEGEVGEPCGVVALVLNDETAKAINLGGAQALNRLAPRRTMSWFETPYSPKFSDQWEAWCLADFEKKNSKISLLKKELHEKLNRPGSFAMEVDEGVVLIDPRSRRILHEFFYK